MSTSEKSAMVKLTLVHGAPIRVRRIKGEEIISTMVVRHGKPIRFRRKQRWRSNIYNAARTWEAKLVGRSNIYIRQMCCRQWPPFFFCFFEQEAANVYALADYGLSFFLSTRGCKCVER
eukprot:1393500-Amorphochlora_amoeboformis.AAC.1